MALGYLAFRSEDVCPKAATVRARSRMQIPAILGFTSCPAILDRCDGRRSYLPTGKNAGRWTPMIGGLAQPFDFTQHPNDPRSTFSNRSAAHCCSTVTAQPFGSAGNSAAKAKG
jgi:hypothetical protein